MSPEETNASNLDIDDILNDMRQPKPGSKPADAQQTSAGASEEESGDKTVFSNIADLLLEADTVPAAESTTDTVSRQTAPKAEKPDGSEQTARAGMEPRPEAKPPIAAESARIALPRKALWALGGLLVLNTAAALAVAVASLFSMQNQQESTRELTRALRESLQAQKAQPEPTPRAAALEGSDAAPPVSSTLQRAEQHYQAAQYDKALPLLQKAVAEHPERSDLLWKAGSSAMNLKQWRDAASAYEKLTANFPHDKMHVQSLMQMGVCYETLGFHSAARKAFYRFIALSGRLSTQEMQVVREAYSHIADCYALEAAAIETPANAK